MSDQTLAIHMPELLYRRLSRLAELTHRPLESLVVQTLSANVPPLPEDLAEPEREALLALETLDDTTLWQVARSMIAPTQHERLSELLERQRDSALTPDEMTELADLRRAADLLMLRKAYAYVLLKWRGRRIPTLAELETQAE
jgi:hypothetical protein